MTRAAPTFAFAAFVFVTPALAAPDPAVSAPESAPSEPKHTNRLIDEKSPYLLQHAHNPVDWYPWGEEAFAAAREQNKPILLSIGYSTCHWCHVMERESFEDEEIAAMLDEHFICVKLAREERPDVDKIYITAVQALTGGSAGWPLNVFLTPDRKPFFGGTYFPPKAAPGRPSWPDLCQRVAAIWDEKRDDVVKDAEGIAAKLEELVNERPPDAGALTESDFEAALAALKRNYDSVNGGWGPAPKFPRPSAPAYLLFAGVRFGDREAIDQVAHTARRMAAGGMYDQLGGGFCRYSVDERWLVPHFEKMLYDNAQLIDLYLDLYQITGDTDFADIARDIARYVLRDMTGDEGCFFSAEDAASEGKEGKFYCWTKAELEQLLTADEMGVVIRYYGVTRSGNFIDHSDPEPLPDQNVLSIADPELAEGEPALLASAKEKMVAARNERVRPGLDDKVLTSWNGLMLGSLARAGAVLGEPGYLAAAEKNAAFLRSTMWDAGEGRLAHRWREGDRDSAQILDTHAYLLDGLIELYGVTLDPAQLRFAIDVADRMLEAFYDEEAGGFFQSAGADDLIMRIKEDHDGAEPSGNSVAALALFKLAEITGEGRYRAAADKTVAHFSSTLKNVPQGMPLMLIAAHFAAAHPSRAVIAGEPGTEATRALVAAAHAPYQPHKVVLGTSGPVEEFAKGLNPEPGATPQVYICKGEHCELPTADADKVRALLQLGPGKESPPPQ